MRLRTYQLCRLCGGALEGKRRWLWLALNGAALLLALLLGAAWLILPALLLADGLIALYALLRRAYFGNERYQRLPRPEDAYCETVLIDATLLGQGTRLRAAAQPIDVAEGLSLRLGSGALLLGTAMTLTADELPPAERSAILSAVNALNIKASRLRSHNPVVSRRQEGELSLLTVRDGAANRVYIMGAPMEVAARCGRIWEGGERELTDHDRLRIADTARYIAQGNCRVIAWATGLEGETPTFLGMAGVGESIEPHAVQEVAALRSMGMTVMLDAAFESGADLESLRAILDLPDHHARPDIHLAPNPMPSVVTLGVARQLGDSLTEPITQLRQQFRNLEGTMRSAAMLLGPAMLFALLCGNALGALLICGLMGFAACRVGVATESRLSPAAALPVLGVALLSRFFLTSLTPELAFMVSGLLCAVVGLCAALRLCEGAFSPEDGASRALLIAAGAMILALVVFGALEGLSCLLPLGFALLLSIAAGLLLLLDSRFLR